MSDSPYWSDLDKTFEQLDEAAKRGGVQNDPVYQQAKQQIVQLVELMDVEIETLASRQPSPTEGMNAKELCDAFLTFLSGMPNKPGTPVFPLSGKTDATPPLPAVDEKLPIAV